MPPQEESFRVAVYFEGDAQRALAERALADVHAAGPRAYAGGVEALVAPGRYTTLVRLGLPGSLLGYPPQDKRCRAHQSPPWGAIRRWERGRFGRVSHA